MAAALAVVVFIVLVVLAARLSARHYRCSTSVYIDVRRMSHALMLPCKGLFNCRQIRLNTCWRIGTLPKVQQRNHVSSPLTNLVERRLHSHELSLLALLSLGLLFSRRVREYSLERRSLVP